MKKFVGGKHSSLLRDNSSDKEKKFYNIGSKVSKKWSKLTTRCHDIRQNDTKQNDISTMTLTRLTLDIMTLGKKYVAVDITI